MSSFDSVSSYRKSDLGNYCQDHDLSDVVQNNETISSSLLSKVIRSGTGQEVKLSAIEKAENITDENLCDALDREVSMPIFTALVIKTSKIGESVLTSAIYQGRADELKVMLESGKTSVHPEVLLGKAKTRKVKEVLCAIYPDLKCELDPKPAPSEPYAKISKEESEDYYLDLLVYQPWGKKEISETLENRAITSATERNFFEARHCADSINDKTKRRTVILKLFTICFEFGDREAIECILKLVKMQEIEERDSYIYCFIKECQKLQDKELAREMSMDAAGAITDPYKKIEYQERFRAK